MPIHIVVGAGPVGRATAKLLADQGDEVRTLSRRAAAPSTRGSSA